MTYRQQMATVILLPLTLMTQGCEQWLPTQKTQTLVVDMTALTKATGKDDEIKAALEQASEQLNARLVKLTNSLNAELAKAENKSGKKPSAESKATYSRLAKEADAKLKLSRRAAELQLNKVRDTLFIQFRSHVGEVASQIATQRGATLVKTSGGNLLWFSPESDITGEVIARLRHESPSRSDSTKSGPVDSATQKEAEKLEKLVEDVEKNQ